MLKVSHFICLLKVGFSLGLSSKDNHQLLQFNNIERISNFITPPNYMIGHWGGLDPTPIFNLSLMLIAGPAITPGPEVGMTQIQTMWTMNG